MSALRKIKPQYTRGEPVKVGFARNQAEAELIQGLLLEEGIPSFLKRTRGFDVPDFLAAGPRDVLVPQAGAEAARRAALRAPSSRTRRQSGQPRGRGPGGAGARRRGLAGWLALGGSCSGSLVAAGIVWLLYQATG